MTKQKVFIGIDPGKKGGLAALNEDGEIVFTWAMMTIGSEYDMLAFVSLIKHIEASYIVLHAALENVTAMQPPTGGSSNFSYGAGKMIWHVTLALSKMTYSLIGAKDWQKHAWKGVAIQYKPSKKKKKDKDTKKTSLIASQRLFPNHSFIEKGCRTPHNGLVDAALIAWACRKEFK